MTEVTQSDSYVKYVPRVYPHELGFCWYETDYMITSSTRKQLNKLNKALEVQPNPFTVTEKEFEKIIDVFEKLRVIRNSQSLQAMCDGFYNRMQIQPALAHRIPRYVLEKIYKEIWLAEQENRKYHKLIRKFWENPDNNESY